MPFELQIGQAVGVTRQVLNQVLSLQDGNAALLFCYLLSIQEPYKEETAVSVLNVEPEVLRRALQRLQQAGIVIETQQQTQQTYQPQQAPEAPRGLVSDERPIYSSKQIADVMTGTVDFRNVVRETETLLGRSLSSSDMQILFSIYEWRGLPPGVMYLLVTHCMEEARQRYGPERPPTLKQIDKEAAQWERDGIDTEARAEAYLAELADRKTLRQQVMGILSIFGREPSPTEARYINEWLSYGLSAELIGLAYDKTVLRTGNLSWKYMDTILKSWHDKKLLTPEEVETGDVRKAIPQQQINHPTSQPQKPSFRPPQEPGSHEKAVVDEMKEFLKRMRQEQEG